MARGYLIEHRGFGDVYKTFGGKCQKACESGDQEARRGQGRGDHLFNKNSTYCRDQGR